MAVFDTAQTLQVISGYLDGAGSVASCKIGEYTSAPAVTAEEFVAAVWMVSTTVQLVYLDGGTKEIHVVNARIYGPAFEGEGSEAREIAMAQVVQKVFADLLADADLGASIRNVDVGGEGGTAIGTEWGHADIDSVMYRIVDLTIPLIVDDSATATP